MSNKETGSERQDTTNKRKGDCSIIGSGASENDVAELNLFYSVTHVEKVEVKLANGRTVKSRHKSKVLFDIGIMSLVLGTGYSIPRLQPSLPSCPRLDVYGITTVISKKTCKLVVKEENNQNDAVIPRWESDGLCTIEIRRP